MLFRIIVITLLIPFMIHQGIGQAPSTEVKSLAPSAREVLAIDIAQQSKSSYTELAAQWKSLAEANPTNEYAWLNYYKAERYADYSASKQGLSNEVQKKLDGILEKMSRNIPGTFAFEYCSYLNKNKSNQAFTHLRNAYAKNPASVELLDDMLCDAIIRKDDAAIGKFTSALSASGVYSASEVEYNKNVLNSIERGGILITNGNVDTYPILLIQRIHNFRTDVKVISLDFLNNETYSAQIASEYNIRFNRSGFHKKITALADEKPIYFSLTLPQDLLSSMRQNLYCTGLAMKYSEHTIENLASLAYNWEYLFSKDQISASDPLNKNYIIPIVLLDQYYRSQNRISEADGIRQKAIEISSRFQMNQKTKKFLE